MPKKILILGGGFGGVRFYKTLHDLTHDSGDYLFQVVNRWNYFLFYPMLHEVATGSVDRSHITQPLREIMNCCLETFYHTDAEHIDFKKIDPTYLVEAMSKMSFSSRDLARAADIYVRMLSEKEGTVILTLAGSTSAAGCM